MSVRAILLLMCMLCVCCQKSAPSKQPIHHVSAQLTTLEERVALIERYVPGGRTYEALEYDITHHDNSGGLLPGPSDWSVRLLARVPCEELSVWIPDGTGHVERDAPGWVASMPGDIDTSGITTWSEVARAEVGVDQARCLVAYQHVTR